MISEVLIEIRDILAHMHDIRVGKITNVGLSLTELAALRDSIKRLNEVVREESKSKKDGIITP